MTKYLRITMPDLSEWDVPMQIIAQSYVDYFRDATVEEVIDDDDVMLEWGPNNMNWSDVAAHAVKVSEPGDTDFQEGWLNGDRTVVEK